MKKHNLLYFLLKYNLSIACQARFSNCHYTLFIPRGGGGGGCFLPPALKIVHNSQRAQTMNLKLDKVSYLANIFQGRIEYELIHSPRGAKFIFDETEKDICFIRCFKPKTTFFAHLRDLRLGNHIIKCKRLNDINRSNLHTDSHDKTSLGLNNVPPTVVLIAPVFFFMNSSWSV